MRLHPVIPMVARHLMKPATIGGIDLPRGRQHRAVDPDRPRPRGQPPRRRTRSARSGSSTARWPPTPGSRSVAACVAASAPGFSLMEGVAVLREVLCRYDVRAARRARPTSRGSATSPACRGTALASWWTEAQHSLQGSSKKPPRRLVASTHVVRRASLRAGHRLRAPGPSPHRARHRRGRARPRRWPSLLYAVWPRFRAWAGWGPLALAVAAVVLTPLSTSSGESLEHRVGDSAAVEKHVAARRHADLVGRPAGRAGGGALLVAPQRTRRTVAAALAVGRVAVLPVVVAVGTLVQVVLIGHSGAESAWGDVGSARPRRRAATAAG